MNYNRFVRNPEVKKLSKIFLSILFFSLCINLYISNRNIEVLNKQYIRQNTYIAGRLSELGIKDNEIISLFISNGTSEEYDNGYNILKKYSYTEETHYSRIDKNKSIFKNNNIYSSLLLGISLSLMFISVIILLWNVFKYICNISLLSNSFVEERFKPLNCKNEEGDLSLLAFEFNSMGKRIKQGIENLQNEKQQLKDYLSDISHQLKTPLASLIMFNQIMLREEDMVIEQRKVFLEKSAEQLDKMEWLILNLLKIGRLEAGVISMNIEKNPIIYTVNNSVSSVRYMAEAKSQSISIECEEAIIIKHDSEWLGEALSNVIKNCIEHTSEEGKIDIRVKDDILSTNIIIKDNGEGMTEEQRLNIFRRFYKGENSSNPNSIGIGMSLSKAIIEKNNGFIRVDSKLGEGSKFTVTFYKGII